VDAGSQRRQGYAGRGKSGMTISEILERKGVREVFICSNKKQNSNLLTPGGGQARSRSK